MAKKLNKSKRDEMAQIQSLIETENESLDMHVLDYFNPASEKMIAHIEEKGKYLIKYATLLEEICDEDIGIGLLRGIMDEIKEIKQELRISLKGSLVDEPLNPRIQLTHITKVNNVMMIDLINRLQTIQRILNTAFMNEQIR